MDRIKWFQSQSNKENLAPNPFGSVDPAPPLEGSNHSVETLTVQLMDESSSLFDRYRAMFTLRDMNTEQSVLALTIGEGSSRSQNVCCLILLLYLRTAMIH